MGHNGLVWYPSGTSPPPPTHHKLIDLLARVPGQEA